jgi:hypothetical protein
MEYEPPPQTPQLFWVSGLWLGGVVWLLFQSGVFAIHAVAGGSYTDGDALAGII